MKCGVMAPAYGMSECTLAISVAAYGKPLKSITINRDRMNVGDKIEETCDTAAGAAFVSVGEILWCIEIRITDNRGRVLPDSHIGNIEISGSTVMSGYYNDPVMTAEAFAEDHWLKTGDIGVIAKGELFITGRSKEIIFIAGKNYFPNDLEKVIEDKFHSLKNRIAVTSVYNAKTGTEQIVLFMHTGDGDFSQKLITDIRRHFSRITRLQIEYIQFTDEFPRTQNGKLQRYKLKELFIAPDDPISMTSKTQNLSTNDGMEAILTICKEELEINEPDMSDNLFEMGADSLKASVILARLNDALSINLTLNQLYKSQTIEDIAKLAEQERQAAGNAGLHSHCDEMVSIPVSAQQKRMYTLFRIDPGHTNYNITAALQIDDDTDVKKIEKAFAAIVKKNEALRTVFHLEHNQIKQTILDYVEFAVETKTAPGDISEEIKNWIRPYDLAHAPLFRLLLMKQDEDCYVLVIDMHHIITDGTSMGLIVKDFENYYNNQTLSKPSYRYRDYAVWQNSMKEQGRFKTQRDFWHTYLKTRSTVLDLPIDAAERPKYRNKIGDNVIFDIPVTGITNLAKEATASPFNVLFSAYCILLSRYAGQDNVVIGVPVSARTKAQFLDVVGLFVNTVPYNVDIDPHETVRDFIARICSMTIDILVNQDYQLDWIVDELHIKRESNRTPLFDVMFTMENMDIPIRQIPLKEVVCKFDLNLIVTKHADGTMDGNLIYATELYVRSSIENMVKHYITILDAMTANPDVKVGELSAADEVQTANTAIDIPVFEY